MYTHTNTHTHVSLVAQMVYNLSPMQKGLASIPGLVRPLEKEMATHSSILAWRIPWTEEPGGLQSMGSQRVRCNWATNMPPPHTYIRVCVCVCVCVCVYLCLGCVYQSSLICVFQIISNVGHIQIPTWLTLTKHVLCARWFHIHYFRDSTSDIRPSLDTVMMIEVVLMKTHGHARSSTCFMSYSGYWVTSSLFLMLWPLPLDFCSVIAWDPGKNHS